MENKLLDQIKSIKNLQIEKVTWRGQETGKNIVHDNNRFYSVVGDQYVPIPYGDLLSKVMEFLPDGIPTSAFANKSLTRAMISIEIPRKDYSVGKDRIKTYVNLLNSLDGSAPIGLLVSPIRVACSNQFVLCKKNAFIHLNYKHIHSRIELFNQDVKILEKVDELVKHQIILAQALNGRKITTQTGLTVIESLHKGLVIPKKVFESANELWEDPIRENDEDRNLWTLFNSITDPLNRLMDEKPNILYAEKIQNVGQEFALMLN